MRELSEVLQGMNQVEFSTRAMFDFKFFVERVFGDEVPDYVNEVVSDILNVLADDTKDGIAIEIPRGHSKTWSFTMNFAVWMLWRTENAKMCLTSSALTQAEDFMEEIQNRLKDNDFFKGIIPSMTKHAWNKSKTTFTNGSKYIVRPFSDTIRGTHVDWFFLDDILREGQLTIDEISKVFFGILYPTIQTKGGKIIFVGTPMSIGDLFSELSNNKSFVVKKYQAVITDDSGNWIRPLWPSKFSLEKLQRIKETMSPMFFEREYMCNPLAGSAGIFGAALLKKQSDSYELPEPLKNCNYYLGVDIALSSQARADFTVFVVIEKDERGQLWVRRLERYKGVDTHFIIDRAKELDRIFRFIKLMPEDRGLSQGIVMDMKNIKLHPEIALRTEGFITTKNNKEALISNLSQQLSSGNLHLLPNDILLRELQAFSKVIDKSGKETFEGIGEHDDCFVEGTLITTPNGCTPIQSLKTGDYVMTRKGPRKIVATRNSPKFVISNYGLTGTPTHPIITTKGIKQLSLLNETDITYIWNQDTLSTEERSIADILIQKENSLKITTGIMGNGKLPQSHYTDKSGLTHMDLLKKDISFTIKTETPLTMISQILKFLKEKYMQVCTWMKKEENNQVNFLRKIGKRYDQNLKYGGKAKNSNYMDIKTYTSYLNQKGINIFAITVEEDLLVKEFQKLNTANCVGEIKRVYNLEVEDVHEYFANGILVHNCVMALGIAVHAAFSVLGEYFIDFV